MSKNNHENIETFNLSKEELMNCFGSQIYSQSSKSNYDYQNENNSQEMNNEENRDINQQREIPQAYNGLDDSNSKYSKNSVNRDEILKNVCYGFIDLFFSQKNELRGIKEEIKKLQNLMINNNNNNAFNNDNNGNRKKIDKSRKNNNQKSSVYNNINNNNENFNYTFKNSKKNQLLNANQLKDSLNQNQSINYKKDNKRQTIPTLSKKPRNKSPNLLSKPKPEIPETVLEVEEEYELANTNQKKHIREKEFNDNYIKDPFINSNSKEEDIEINLANIKDDEFDEVLKNRNPNKNKLKNNPFIKSSELKKKPNPNNNKDIYINNNKKELKDDSSNVDINNKENNEKNEEIDINDPNLGVLNLDLDEALSDFKVGGKRITFKVNDNLRKIMNKEISSLDEPVNILEELDKNKKPSNIFHNNSKLSTSSNMVSKNKLNADFDLKIKASKRNYNTMISNSKNIKNIEEKSESKDIIEENKNGSSMKDRKKFLQDIKKYGHPDDNDDIVPKLSLNLIKSNPTSNTNTQNSLIKKIKNKKFSYSTISNCQFYCLCQKESNKKKSDNIFIENSKCKICKNKGIINIHNFKKGFYYYILNNPETTINISNNNFKLLGSELKEINDKDKSIIKDLDNFFNYQFIFLVYDKYIKLSREKENSSEQHIEDLIEDIYKKLIDKYVYIFIKSKRSFLTEVAEGESSLGFANALLLLMNIKKSEDNISSDKIIEFSDGYKSCFTTIKSNDPINKLMNNHQMTLHNWMNVEIAMAKVLNISEDFSINIKIYYNAISPSKDVNTDFSSVNYGPLIDKKKFLSKNILELRNDGGEISLINVIIIKKYEYYINNKTKKQRCSRKKYENDLLKLPESSEKKNYENDGEEKNNNNHERIKEPDSLIFHFLVIAMDYDVYLNIKNKNRNENKNLEQMLKKKYIIDFCVKSTDIYEMIEEGKIYQLMFLNLENKNNNSNNNIIPNNKKYYYNLKENDIIIKFNDKSEINEISLGINYKSDNDYKETLELINKSINLTNNQDIGKIFIDCIENNKVFNSKQYLNKEYFIVGIYSGYLDKISSIQSSEKNESSEINNSDEYVNRYIFLTLGESKIAIIKIHKDDFFWIDVKSNSIKDKIFHCKDVLFKEIIYYDEDSNQPKITGQNKMENSIPLLSLETNNYSLINYGNYNKSKENKEEIDLLIKYRNDNKELVDKIAKLIP